MSNVRVVDLGTEFLVALIDDDHLRVQVLDGEVDVQSRVRLPLYFWNFDADGSFSTEDGASTNSNLVLGSNATWVNGIVGGRALSFDNTADSLCAFEQGRSDKVGTGTMACSSGITIEAMVIPQWSGQWQDYDEIFRKEDGIYRVLLGFQNDGNVGDYADPEVPSGPCLSFGLHLETIGYSELDMPLDGRDGRPGLNDLKDGMPHHIVATYDSFTGQKAIYIDGKFCFHRDFPVALLNP